MMGKGNTPNPQRWRNLPKFASIVMSHRWMNVEDEYWFDEKFRESRNWKSYRKYQWRIK